MNPGAPRSSATAPDCTGPGSMATSTRWPRPIVFGWPGGERIAIVPQGLPCTAMGWEVDPTGLSDLLLGLRRDHPTLPIMVTENGAAYDDRPTSEGRVRDPDRIEYLKGHLRAAQR